MHAEALDFVARVLSEDVGDTTGLRVLEIGSRSEYRLGQPRDLCQGAFYVGIDRVAGRNVDLVCDVAQYDGMRQWDVVVCCEVLEHAPEPAVVIAAAWRALKSGGRLILTAAGPERDPHSCEGGLPRPGEHYRGVDVAEIERLLVDWQEVRTEAHVERGDVYARAVRP